MSYYDLSFSSPAFYEAENVTYSDENQSHQYENVYQYDGVNFGSSVYLSGAIQSANVFTARDDELVQAISTMTHYSGSTFTYQIYKNLTDKNNPESGTLVAQGSEYFENAGYYTVDLEKTFAVKKGESFAVVIQMATTVQGNKFYVVMHESSSQYVNTDISAGQTFFKQLGTWKDISKEGIFNSNMFGNAVVKVFSSDWSGVSASDITYGDSLSKSVISGDSYRIGSQTYKGSYQWKSPGLTPDAGTDIYTAVFTPNDSSVAPVDVDVMVNVAKRTLEYRMKSYTRCIGEENPIFEAELVSGSLVDGDEIHIEASCNANKNSPLGTYKITGRADEQKNYIVTIRDGALTVNKVDVTSIEPSASKVNLSVGQKYNISVKINPPNATFRLVTWSTSNKSVADVSYGTITAVGAGTATITVMADGKKASIKVTVNPATPTGLKLSTKKRKLTVKYQKGKGATGTQIYIVSAKKNKKVKDKKATGKSYTVKLAKGKYKVKIRSYKKVKGKYYYSSYTGYKSITVK